MERIQTQHRRSHNRALQPNKVFLRLDQVSRPALAQLRHTIHTSSENAQRREGQRNQESLECPAVPQLLVLRIQRLLLSQSAHTQQRPNAEVCGQKDEDKESCDLEGQAGNHDVVADGGVLVGVRLRGGQTAAGCLQEERDDVAGDEDARVREGRDAGVLGAEGHDYPGEAEVDACGHERRRDRQADDLHEKAVLQFEWLAFRVPWYETVRLVTSLNGL